MTERRERLVPVEGFEGIVYTVDDGQYVGMPKVARSRGGDRPDERRKGKPIADPSPALKERRSRYKMAIRSREGTSSDVRVKGDIDGLNPDELQSELDEGTYSIEQELTEGVVTVPPISEAV